MIKFHFDLSLKNCAIMAQLKVDRIVHGFTEILLSMQIDQIDRIAVHLRRPLAEQTRTRPRDAALS